MRATISLLSGEEINGLSGGFWMDMCVNIRISKTGEAHPSGTPYLHMNAGKLPKDG